MATNKAAPDTDRGYTAGQQASPIKGLIGSVAIVTAGLALAWSVLSPFLQPGRGRASWRWPLECSTAPTRILAVGALLLGLAPLLLYNLRDLGTLQLLSTNLTQAQLYGVNNLDLSANLQTVFLEDFPVLLRGNWWAGPTDELHVNRLALPAFLWLL